MLVSGSSKVLGRHAGVSRAGEVGGPRGLAEQRRAKQRRVENYRKQFNRRQRRQYLKGRLGRRASLFPVLSATRPDDAIANELWLVAGGLYRVVLYVKNLRLRVGNAVRSLSQPPVPVARTPIGPPSADAV